MDNIEAGRNGACESFVSEWHFQKPEFFCFFLFPPRMSPLLRDVNGSRTSQFRHLLSLPGRAQSNTS